MPLPDQLLKGQTFHDGDIVDGATLNALVDQGTILGGSIMEQTALAGVIDPADQMLVYDTSAAGLRRAAFSQMPGTGTVTNVTAGNLAGVFTTSVGTPTTTPALSFAMASASGNRFLASPANGSSGALAMRQLVPADLPSATVTVAASLIDWSLGNCFHKLLSAAVTFAFSNPSEGQSIRVLVAQDASHTVAWPTGASGVYWPGGTVPVMTTGAGRHDLYIFHYIAGHYWGSFQQNFLSV